MCTYAYIHRIISTPISDWRFATVTASPYYFILRHSWGKPGSLSVSRKTYFLGYPDGGEIKGVAETKGADKIKEGQWRDRRGLALQLAVQYREIDPSLPIPCSALNSLPHSSRYKEKDSMHSWESYIWLFISTPKNYVRCIDIFTECLGGKRRMMILFRYFSLFTRAYLFGNKIIKSNVNHRREPVNWNRLSLKSRYLLLEITTVRIYRVTWICRKIKENLI